MCLSNSAFLVCNFKIPNASDVENCTTGFGESLRWGYGRIKKKYMAFPRRKFPRRPPPAMAFTLIEVLVVIGLLAVLISLLVPAAGQLRERAATQVTISNLKQLQSANSLYASDHGGKCVPAQVNGDYSNGMWFQNEDFLRYLEVPKTDRMWDEDWPAMAKSGIRSASPNQPPGKMDRQASLAINLGLRQHWANPDGSFADLGFQQSSILRPSKSMAFADATDTWIRMDRADKWQSDQKSAENGWYNMSIAYRNNGKAGVVFFDGHVELLSREQVVGNWDLWIPDSGS